VGGAVQASQQTGAETEQRTAPATRSLLVVDCGSVFTKAALLGLVEGRYRLLARAQAATTSVPPVENVMVGVREAITALEKITGRQLLEHGALIAPERDSGDGVDGLALATSVGGPLHLLAAGPGRDALAGLLHRSIGGLFVQLDALPPLPEDGASSEWHELAAHLRALHPHGVLVVGSPFGAARATSTLEETARAVGAWLDMLREPVPRGTGQVLPVLFSGSASDAAQLTTALQGRANVQVVEALSPSTLAPLNRSVGSLYEGAVLRRVAGFAELRGMTRLAPAATITALGGLVRFLAQHFQTTVVGVDVGASATVLTGATVRGEFLPAEDPNAGVGPGAGHVLRSVGAQSVLRWVSEPASEDELREYVLTRMLHPRRLPSSPRELQFEHALAREAIGLAMRAPGSRLAGLQSLDVVLGTGGVLAHTPHPAMAALILLDVLQPRGITSIVLDAAQLASMLGGIAGLDQTAAAEVAETDAVAVQLGTFISTVGAVAAGEPALRVVLEFPDGRQHVEDVAQGTIARLPLPPGERALLGLYPAPAVDVGLGPGQHARASEPVDGGVLGLVVDARGRPLTLPADGGERLALLTSWRRGLGLEA
jgi:hypothetical protein